MFSIRGAITIEEDSRKEILEASDELLREIIRRNEIVTEDIISVIFSSTRDVSSAYPAEAARAIGINHAGLMCLQEMHVEGSLDKCIRVLTLVRGDRMQDEAKHVYLRKASSLRPDLMQEF